MVIGPLPDLLLAVRGSLGLDPAIAIEGANGLGSTADQAGNEQSDESDSAGDDHGTPSMGRLELCSTATTMRLQVHSTVITVNLLACRNGQGRFHAATTDDMERRIMINIS